MRGARERGTAERQSHSFTQLFCWAPGIVMNCFLEILARYLRERFTRQGRLVGAQSWGGQRKPSGDVAFNLRSEGRAGVAWAKGRVFTAEGTACAKAPR